MSKIDTNIKKIILNELKYSLTQATYPPNYEDDYIYYKINSNDYWFNCYSYAMQFKCNYQALRKLYPNLDYIYNPGYFIMEDYKPPTTPELLVDYFKEDCKLFDLECTPSSIDEELALNEYKIALFLSTDIRFLTQEKDYHFMRQNADLSWSEMTEFCGVVKQTYYPKTSGYDLIDIFKIKKLI